jgi:hypothetical protein
MITEWSPWTGRETLCTALALAWVVPTAFHIYRRRRFGSVLRFERLGWMDGEPAGYRAPPPYRALLDAQALGAHFGAYTWRLLAATALGATVFFELWGPSFVKRHDCTPRPMFSVPEYLTYCALLLLVMLLHMPTPRRVFGVSTARLRRAAQ